MKIVGHDAVAVRVPIDDVAVSEAMGTYVVMRLYTDEDVEGFGYATSIAPAATPTLLAVLDGYIEALKGRNPLDIEAIVTPTARFGSPSIFRKGAALPGYQARAARLIDTALWDVKGKIAGMPVHRLMGGFRDRVPCYASWRIEPGTTYTERLGESAKHLVDQGFRAMKFHVRTLDAEGTVRHMRTLREAVGPDIAIMVDNFQGWDLKESMRMAERLAPYDPYWIEDPMAIDDYEGMRELRRSTRTYLCAGETCRSLGEFRQLLEHRCLDIAMVDLDMGLTGFLKVAHLAEAYDMPIVSHLSTEVLAHAVAAVPNGAYVEYIPYAQPLFAEPLVVEDGNLVLPAEPGLGLELDLAAVEKFALR